MRAIIIIFLTAAIQNICLSTEIIGQSPEVIIKGSYHGKDPRVSEHNFPVEIQLSKNGTAAVKYQTWIEELNDNGNTKLSFFDKTVKCTWRVNNRTILVYPPKNQPLPQIKFMTYPGLNIKIAPNIPISQYQQWDDARAVRDYIYMLKRTQKDKKKHTQFLLDKLKASRNSPTEAILLLELGNIHKDDSPELAEKYYQQTIDCPHLSDQWGFTQQHACQELSKLYEKQKKYRKAIEALKKWKISEPCGNGAASSRIRKTFQIWRLSMHFRNHDKIRNEMWADIESGKIAAGLVSDEMIAKNVLSLYQPDNLPDLSNRLQKETKYMENRSPKNGAEKRAKKGFPKLSKTISDAIKKAQSVEIKE